MAERVADKAETARRLKGRISAVLCWAVAQQYRPDDPTAAAAAALPSNNGHRGHFAALAHSDMPAALAPSTRPPPKRPRNS